MERGGVGESRGQVIARRLKTVPAVVLGLIVVTALVPVLLVVAVVVDLARFAGSRKPFMATRLLAFLWIYLAGETFGLLALFGLWLGAGLGHRREWMAEWTWRFQQVWAGWMFWGVRRVMGLRVEVEGQAALTPGPVIVLVRHASIVDNLLPAVFVARAHRIHLRYVMKRELLSDPCLDVAGKRLPNYFVRRDTGESVEVENVQRLAEGLAPQDGLLLYPEGTRFTEERRLRAIEKVRERDPERGDRVEQLVHLLPPKVGGFVAVLDGAPGVDVVVMAHAGFDGLRLISDIWQGSLVGRVITVGFTRIDRSEIPSDTGGRVAWLDAAWLKADIWVGNQLHKTMTLLINLLVVLALTTALWAVSVAIADSSIVDIFWGFGFVVIAWVSYLIGDGSTDRKLLLAVVTTIWGLRLTLHLARRNIGKGEDQRYQAMRARHGDKWPMRSLWAVFWGQGLLMWTVSLPIQVAATDATPAGLIWLDYLGAGVWLVGLLFETTGDRQLSVFKADPANKGKVMDRGLWSWTRHPNYFGDFTVWWGIYLIALSTTSAWWTIIGPIVMSVLLIRVSGAALLERGMKKSRPGYEEYVRTTSGFFPRPPRA